MPVTQSQREFWTTKNPAREYDVVIFEHYEFEQPVRLVLNEHKIQIFQGKEFIPVAAKLSKPEQGGDPISSVSIQFSRIHVGDKFKEVIRKITPFGWAKPIKMIVQQYSELDMNNPSQHWQLFVAEDGVRFNRNSVDIKASDDNPMIMNVSSIYTIEDYPGLARL